jgi:hypothetical protein
VRLTRVCRFGLITEDGVRCGVVKSVAVLVAAIQQYRWHGNADPKLFARTAPATAIFEKMAHGRSALAAIHQRYWAPVF